MIFLELTFDGTNFFGWNSSSEKRIVFSVLKDALWKISRIEPFLTPSCQLISGCHAVQFFVKWDNNFKIDEDFIYKINRCLPKDIAVRNVFDSDKIRFQPKMFFYEYHIHFIKQPFLEQRSFYKMNNNISLNEDATTINVDCIKTDNRLVIKMNHENLNSEQALNVASKITNIQLPAYGLYLTHTEFIDFQTQNINSDQYFIPEPNWFFKK